MKQVAWIVFGLLTLPLLAHAGMFGIGNNGEVATRVATLNEDSEIGGLDFSPDGIHLVAMPYHYSKNAHIWDWRNGKIEQTIDEADADLLATEQVRYSPDGQFLVRCGNPTNIWNTNTWKIVSSIDNIAETRAKGLTGGMCQSLGFTPDGKLLLLVLDRSVIAYDTSTWKTLWSLPTTPLVANTLAVSPDGRLAAIGGTVFTSDQPEQSQVSIIDLEQHTIIRNIQQPFPTPPQGHVYYELRRIAWNPNGAQIAVGIADNPTDGTDIVRIFDLPSGKQVANETASWGLQIRALRYTPDGKYLIETGIDKKVKIWNGQHNKLLQEISADPASCAISKDGHFLAIGGVATSFSDVSALLGLIFPGKGKVIIYELK